MLLAKRTSVTEISCASVQVLQQLDRLQLEPTEPEYALLLEACAAGAPWSSVQKLLHRVTRELTLLQDTTLAAAEAYFRYMPCMVKL